MVDCQTKLDFAKVNLRLDPSFRIWRRFFVRKG